MGDQLQKKKKIVVDPGTKKHKKKLYIFLIVKGVRDVNGWILQVNGSGLLLCIYIFFINPTTSHPVCSVSGFFFPRWITFQRVFQNG